MQRISPCLRVSFMSMEEAGCPKNSNRRTRVVGAPKLSWQTLTVTKNTKHIQAPKAHPKTSRHVRSSHVRHLRPPERKAASSKPECKAVDRYDIHMITNPRRRAIRQLQVVPDSSRASRGGSFNSETLKAHRAERRLWP